MDGKKKKEKAEWGQVLLVEDQYPSSSSDEDDQAEELFEQLETQKNLYKKFLSQKLDEKVKVLSPSQKKILKKMEDRKVVRDKDEMIMKKKRA